MKFAYRNPRNILSACLMLLITAAFAMQALLLTYNKDVQENIKLFFDARNLMYEENISAFSAVTDARTAGTNVFYPGEGRSFYAGVLVKF